MYLFRYETVELGVEVSGERLERILIESANEVGLRAKSYDDYSTVYKPGSVKKEKFYCSTDIRLRRWILPVARIIGVKRDRNTKSFNIIRGSQFGFGSDILVEKYLGIVFEKINGAATA